MKNYVSLFEKFEEAFDDFYQKPDIKSDTFYQTIANELIELAGQYMETEPQIDMHSDKYATHTRIKDLQNDLLVQVNDAMGEQMAEDFATASDELLGSYEIAEKAAQSGESMKRSKIFKKDDEVEENDLLQDNPVKSNTEKAGKTIAIRPRQTKTPNR